MYAKIKEYILEVEITYQEMLPLVLKHVETITSWGSFPCLASHVPCSWTTCLLSYAIICSLRNLCLDLYLFLLFYPYKSLVDNTYPKEYTSNDKGIVVTQS